MLEHLASTIGPWIDILNHSLPRLSCSISLTDNTTSAGWLRKSNFHDTDDTTRHMSAKLQVACSHAARFLKHDIREYSQWFPGKDNILADSLSRDFHLSDSELTQLLLSFPPLQTRLHFNIVPLPPRIISWISAWLQQLPVNHTQQEAHRPSNIELGKDGQHSCNPLIFPTTVCNGTCG